MHKLRFDEKRVLRRALDTSDLWRIAGKVRLDFPRFLRTLKALEKRGLVTTGPGTVHLTGRGRSEAALSGLRSPRSTAMRILKARKKFAEVARQRPASLSRYNQGFMTVDSVFSRIAVITEMGDADSRSIAVLGDDDLMSIGLCLAARPEGVTVFEIDPRLVDFITKIGDEQGLPIDARCHDLREPFPSDLRGRFHTFVTDPSETMEGLRMFLGRGLGLLKPEEGHAGYFGLTSIEASARKWNQIQRWLLSRYSVAITHILPEHSYYRNWPDLLDQTSVFRAACLEAGPKKEWFNASLFRLETLSDFKPRRMGSIKGPIFNDDEACGEIGGAVR